MESGRRRVLIVDDDPDTRDLLSEALSPDFEVVAVGDADAALEVLASRPIDVLLTDETLPGMRGAQLAREAKQRLPTLRVVLFSGHLTIPGAEHADSVARKPLDLDQLMELVGSSPQH